MSDPGPTQPAAIRFLWLVLVLASCASVAGNVTHAVLVAPEGTVVLAAVAALVAPAVLLAATHTVALLVRARADSGATYWCALLMTVGLAAAAFVLSFDALRDLAVAVGVDRRIAWLWPVLIDVSIAQSTTALLSLTRRDMPTAEAFATTPPEEEVKATVRVSPRRAVTSRRGGSPAQRRQSRDGQSTALANNALEHISAVRPLAAAMNVVSLDGGGGGDAQWAVLAQKLIEERKTRLPAATVEQVLVLLSRRHSKRRICSQLGVHHSVVGRLQDALVEYELHANLQGAGALP